MNEPRYLVRTYDWSLGEYTPHAGIDCGPHRLMALRDVLRQLRGCGYSARYGGARRAMGDSDVLVERVSDE